MLKFAVNVIVTWFIMSIILSIIGRIFSALRGKRWKNVYDFCFEYLKKLEEIQSKVSLIRERAEKQTNKSILEELLSLQEIIVDETTKMNNILFEGNCVNKKQIDQYIKEYGYSDSLDKIVSQKLKNCVIRLLELEKELA